MPVTALPSSSPFSSYISWLPVEVLSGIFVNLASPLDLYHASLVCHNWRAAATKGHLWQIYYWAFYRAPSFPQEEDERALLAAREKQDCQSMRAWLDQARATAPPSPLGALCVTKSSGATTYYEPLAKGIVLVIGMIVLDESENDHGYAEAIHERVRNIVRESYGPHGPHDAEEACERVMSILLRECGKRPTTRDFAFVREAWPFLKEDMEAKLAMQEGPPSYPAFLNDKTQGKHSQLPDFHALFVRRMNVDQLLLQDLRSHVDLERGQLESLLQMVERYGDDARDLLLALCAGQQLSAVKARPFTPPHSTASSKHGWSNALNVHARAASGILEPCPTPALLSATRPTSFSATSNDARPCARLVELRTAFRHKLSRPPRSRSASRRPAQALRKGS